MKLFKILCVIVLTFAGAVSIYFNLQNAETVVTDAQLKATSACAKNILVGFTETANRPIDNSMLNYAEKQCKGYESAKAKESGITAKLEDQRAALTSSDKR
jgi:uncharacterized protein (UPF0333 family)